MIETQQKIGEDFETKTKQNKHQKVAYNFNSLSTQNTFVFYPFVRYLFLTLEGIVVGRHSQQTTAENLHFPFWILESKPQSFFEERLLLP